MTRQGDRAADAGAKTVDQLRAPPTPLLDEGVAKSKLQSEGYSDIRGQTANPDESWSGKGMIFAVRLDAFARDELFVGHEFPLAGDLCAIAQSILGNIHGARAG